MDYSGGFSLSGLLIAQRHERSQPDFSIGEALFPRRFFRTDREPQQSDVRQRYDFPFDLIQNALPRISEPLAVKVRDVRLANGIA